MLVHAQSRHSIEQPLAQALFLTDLTTCHDASALVLIELFVEGGDLGREQALHHARLWEHQRDLRSPASDSWSCKGEDSPHPGSDTNDGSSACWAQEHTGNQGMRRGTRIPASTQTLQVVSVDLLLPSEQQSLASDIANRMRNRTPSVVVFLADNWPSRTGRHSSIVVHFHHLFPIETRGGGSHIEPIHREPGSSL